LISGFVFLTDDLTRHALFMELQQNERII